MAKKYWDGFESAIDFFTNADDETFMQWYRRITDIRAAGVFWMARIEHRGYAPLGNINSNLLEGINNG